MCKLLSRKRLLCFFSICFFACFLFSGCGGDEIETDLIGSDELEIINDEKLYVSSLFDELPNRTTDKSVADNQSASGVTKNDENLIVEDKGKTEPEKTEDNSYIYTQKENTNISGGNTGSNLTVNNTEFYILNKNTKKFHLQACSSVKDIKDKNRGTEFDRNKILAQGFIPCKRCNP